MTAFHSSVPDRLPKGRGGIQIWACQGEPGEKGGISQAPASRPLLGTHPLGRAGAGLDPTSLGRRHSNSLCMLSPRDVKGLTQEGRKAEHIPKGHSQVYLKHKAASPPAPPAPLPRYPSCSLPTTYWKEGSPLSRPALGSLLSPKEDYFEFRKCKLVSISMKTKAPFLPEGKNIISGRPQVLAF